MQLLYKTFLRIYKHYRYFEQKRAVGTPSIYYTIIRKENGKKRRCHMVLKDFKKVNDSVPRAMQRNGISDNIIKKVKQVNEENNLRIKTENRMAANFKTPKSLQQSCLTSPTLFHIFLELPLQPWKYKCAGI